MTEQEYPHYQQPYQQQQYQQQQQQQQQPFQQHPATPGLKSFWYSMIDLKFRENATPHVASVAYIVGLVLILLGGFAAFVMSVLTMVTAFNGGVAFLGFLFLLASIVGTFLYAVLWRMILEFIVVQFSILEELKSLNSARGR